MVYALLTLVSTRNFCYSPLHMSKEANWGFDIKNIDASVRPQDDFYHYANGGWLKKAKIPPEEARWGSFFILRVETEHQLKLIIDELLKKKRHAEGSPEQLVADLYRSAAGMLRRNTLGTRPLEPLLQEVRAIQSKNSLIGLIARLHRLGAEPFWGIGIEQDFKNSSIYRLYLGQGGLGMPDREYYLLDKPEQKRVRDAYIKHIEALARLTGKTPKGAGAFAQTVMKIETRLARASMRKEDLRDPEKIYHKKTPTALKRQFPQVDWSSYLAGIRAPKVAELIVMQPQFFADVSRLLHETSLEELKTYVEWHLISDLSGLLSEKFVKQNFKWTQTLTGQKKMRAPWRRALGAVNAAVDESLGKLYVDAYFDNRSKKVMDALVTDLFAVYAARIKELDWMRAATKRKALKKLRAMGRKIAYPAKYEHYRGLIIKSDDYFGNMLRAAEWDHARDMRKLRNKKVDRSEWITAPQVVNAFYNPLINDINFPAAILQSPFFDVSADTAVNYAGIGTIIGHEMTHGFDDEGSKFDGAGNLKGWWQKPDRARFMKKAQLLVGQYNTYEAAPGVHTNGQLTLGENIADLGGLCIGWDAYQRYLQKNGRRTIAGLSPEERFFLGFAQMERALTREEYRKMQALNDPHAEASQRINGPLANFEPFYKTFGVKKGDKLYREPKKRAKIW